jgi:hypothetical protein
MYQTNPNDNVFMSPKLAKTVKKQGDYYLDMRTSDNKSRFRAFSPKETKKLAAPKPPKPEKVKEDVKTNKTLRQ